MDETKQPGLSIGQIFLARAHFEHRADYLNLPGDAGAGQDHAPVRVSTRVGLKPDGTSGIISITVISDAEDAIYRYEIEMVGVINQDAVANMPVKDFLVKNGPSMMYPFLREAVANLTSRGRFGPSWLRPFNWRAVQGQTAAETTGDSVSQAGE
jgi:preprotein translocase subunit SecB